MRTAARTWRSAAAACAVLALAACGGGGGGGGGGGESAAPEPPPAPASTASTPLAITADNMGDVAAYAPGWSENVLQIGELAATYANRFRTGATPVTDTCPNGGVVTLTLTDNDGNGKLSAGDRVVAELKDCGVALWNAVLAGTFTVDVSASGDSPRSVRGTASMGGPGLTLASSSGGVSTAQVRLRGSLGFDWSKNDIATTIAVASTSADDLRITGSGDGQTVTEWVRAIAVTKTLQYDEARVKLRVALRYDSEVLGGSVTVSTPQPVQAYLDTYPEQGEIDIKGANGVALHLTPNFVTNSEYVNVGLDSNGDERVDTTVLMPWQNLTYGYLWWNGRSTLAWGYSPYSTQSYSSTAFTYTTSGSQTGVNDAVWIQFSRPPVDLPALRVRLRDQGSSDYSYNGYDGYINVDADVSMRGALVLAQPRTQLRHARSYALELSLDDGATWSPYAGLTVHDALGNGLTLYGSSYVTTPDTMRAKATQSASALTAASQVNVLDASTSTSARTVRSYRWAQISGTPLALATPDAVSTEVRWGSAAPVGMDTAVIELVVTDVAGEEERTRISVASMNLDNPGARALYFRSTPGDYVGGGQTYLGSDSNGTFAIYSYSPNAVSVNFNEPNYAHWWNLSFGSSTTQPLAVGAYENASGSPGANQPYLYQGGDGRGCTNYGRFDVLEIARDGSGNVTTLAIDYESRCDSATAPPLYGSLRINSSIPIRR